MNADFILLTKSKGAYARLDLESSVVDARRGPHKAYYSHFRLSRSGLLIEMSQYLVKLERRLQEGTLHQWSLRCPQIGQATGLCDIGANLKNRRFQVVLRDPFFSTGHSPGSCVLTHILIPNSNQCPYP